MLSLLDLQNCHFLVKSFTLVTFKDKTVGQGGCWEGGMVGMPRVGTGWYTLLVVSRVVYPSLGTPCGTPAVQPVLDGTNRALAGCPDDTLHGLTNGWRVPNRSVAKESKR